MKSLQNYLKYFCDKEHQDFYKQNYQNMLGAGVQVTLFEAMISVWEQYRKDHKRCFYCSQKLPTARQKTI